MRLSNHLSRHCVNSELNHRIRSDTIEEIVNEGSLRAICPADVFQETSDSDLWACFERISRRFIQFSIGLAAFESHYVKLIPKLHAEAQCQK